jgi:hypothetical protein
VLGAALLVALAGAAGCGREPVEPEGLGVPGGRPIGYGGGAGGAAGLVGAWRADIVIGSGGDVVRTTTIWLFADDGSCRLTRESLSGIEGIPRTTERGCTWSTANGRVQVSFADGGTDEFAYQQNGTDSDTLVLDGIAYTRVEA